MKRKFILIILIGTLLLNIAVLPVFAETSSDYKNKINEATKEIEQLDSEIDKEMQAVEDITSQINTINSEIGLLDQELSELAISIAEKTKELQEKKQLLEDRMVAMYMAGETTYLDVLLCGGIIDFVSNYYLVNQVVEFDSNLINEVEQIKQTLESEKAIVEQKKKEKEEKQASLESLKSQKEIKVASLTQEQKQKQAQVDAWDNKMKELEAAERAAAAAAANKNNGGSSSNQSFKYSGGALQWPVPSSNRITSYYGYRIHPIYKTRKLHAGLDIGAPTGTSIVAAESGTVILSSVGYNGGYGNYIIINHGNGLTTRYAHCSTLCVSVGQTVTRGQVIAKVGSTGASTGPHLHFEVRINGSSTDPLNYLK